MDLMLDEVSKMVEKADEAQLKQLFTTINTINSQINKFGDHCIGGIDKNWKWEAPALEKIKDNDKLSEKISKDIDTVSSKLKTLENKIYRFFTIPEENRNGLEQTFAWMQTLTLDAWVQDDVKNSIPQGDEYKGLRDIFDDNTTQSPEAQKASELIGIAKHLPLYGESGKELLKLKLSTGQSVISDLKKIDPAWSNCAKWGQRGRWSAVEGTPTRVGWQKDNVKGSTSDDQGSISLRYEVDNKYQGNDNLGRACISSFNPPPTASYDQMPQSAIDAIDQLPSSYSLENKQLIKHQLVQLGLAKTGEDGQLHPTKSTASLIADKGLGTICSIYFCQYHRFYASWTISLSCRSSWRHVHVRCCYTQRPI